MPDERFIDAHPPCSVYNYGYFCIPEFFNQITLSAGRRESVYARGEDELMEVVVPQAVRKYQDAMDLLAHFRVMHGMRYIWPLRDPMDFASHGQTQPIEEPTISTAEVVIGTGDGAETDFQLVKVYTAGDYSYSRPIYLPVLDSLIVTVNDVVQDGDSSPGDYDVSRPGGIISFAVPPAEGAVIKAGFLFEIAVRYASDKEVGTLIKNWRTAGNTDLTLIEVRLCED